jgi:endoglucanase
MTRRQFLGATVTAAAAGVAGSAFGSGAPSTQPSFSDASASHLPRWRGFNLLDKYQGNRNRPFREADFELIAEWGFNFVRLPMSYLCWTDLPDWFQIREQPLKDIDQAVEFGRQHGVHVNLNLHRAPGYCVNPPKEPLDLWSDDNALDACAFHWSTLAKRYKGIPSSRVSFDLLNEPPDIPVEQYLHVVTRLVEAIRSEDPDRLVIADGLKFGGVPVPQLADLKVAQSTRGYAPGRVSHYQASWVQGADLWPEPTWPIDYTVKDKDGNEHAEHWDKARLKKQQIEPWQKLEAQGVGVHVGEWGAHNRTPHEVVLAWMADYLDLWRQAGWGWSLWNLHGSFGVLDSARRDVNYETFRGHKLDRRMLELLRNG